MPTTTTANPPSPPNTHALPGRYYPLSVLPRAASALALGPLCKSQQEKHREALSLSLSLALSCMGLLLAYAQPKRFHSLVHFYLSSFSLPTSLPPAADDAAAVTSKRLCLLSFPAQVTE
ncbi:hypothetical protein CPAR01_10641 [Colletotrichum paranaense]|uniref:Uncharacterized protein n=1 Tax=Colletotrichum paranaense TaxID=1914294 RepID=A0ABQ9SEM5_9PEZI|nr:uncharacterized protein CPAR01_10641 [Colletotrichum paranaense]KAK1533933.1 hypothetical protein CPAR01_10641 [Colletotrichum paranaense]